MNIERKQTLIVDGTGKTGRRVVQRFQERGLRVRVAARSVAPGFSWADEESWPAALQQVHTVYLAYYPDLALPEAAEQIRAFSELARHSGVQKIVLLSGRAEKGAQASEQAVRDSGVSFTILRASWFCQNFSEGHLLESVQSGQIRLPAANVAEPFVDAEDIADVAFAALDEAGHAGLTYELTGPRLLTFAEAAAEIARAAGREVSYVPLSAERYLAELATQLPPDLARSLTELFLEVLDGRNAYLGDGVQRVLGRQPRDFSDYVRAAAASGIWSS